MSAETHGGNILLNLPTGFAADVDAVVITSDPNAPGIVSELPGLTVTREQVDGKTKIRAVGKINGGGAKLDLRSKEGTIQLRNRVVPLPNGTAARR
jgi:hypothetical protein